MCIVAAAIAPGLLLAACGPSTTTSPASGATNTAASAAPGPTSAVCQAAAELRTSVDALAHVKIGAGTVDEVKSDLANIEAKLTALTTELHDANKTETSAVQSAVAKLKTAVSDVSAHPSASTFQGLVTAVGGVTTTVGTLLASLAPQCGSATASPSS